MSIEVLYQDVNTLFKQGRGVEVEAVLQRHLLAAQAVADPAWELAVRNEQVGYYRNRGDNSKALEVCRAAGSLLDAGAAASPADEATTLLNIATAYRAAGAAQEALPLYLRARDLYEVTLSPEDPLRAALCNNMAQAYLELGQLSRAAELLAEALDILKANPDTGEEVALTHSNLAALYLNLDRLEEAEDHLRQALALSDVRPEAANRAAILGALATLLHKQGHLPEAVARYREAMAAMERTYGRNSGYASMARNLALAEAALEEAKP